MSRDFEDWNNNPNRSANELPVSIREKFGRRQKPLRSKPRLWRAPGHGVPDHRGPDRFCLPEGLPQMSETREQPILAHVFVGAKYVREAYQVPEDPSLSCEMVIAATSAADRRRALQIGIASEDSTTWKDEARDINVLASRILYSGNGHRSRRPGPGPRDRRLHRLDTDPSMKTKTIPGTCSSANCNGAPIAAELVDGLWVSRCLRRFKRSGKIDWNKAVKNGGRTDR